MKQHARKHSSRRPKLQPSHPEHWLFLILILLVAGMVHVETRRSSAVLLDCIQQRDVILQQASVIRAAREVIALQEAIILRLLKPGPGEGSRTEKEMAQQ